MNRNTAARLPVLLMLVALSACGASLGDAQRVWCEDHDMTRPYFIATTDDQVLQAAETLGITIPDKVRRANAIFALENAGTDLSVADDLPDGWPDALDEWRMSPDYARACIAAFDAR